MQRGRREVEVRRSGAARHPPVVSTLLLPQVRLLRGGEANSERLWPTRAEHSRGAPFPLRESLAESLQALTAVGGTSCVGGSRDRGSCRGVALCRYPRDRAASVVLTVFHGLRTTRASSRDLPVRFSRLTNHEVVRRVCRVKRPGVENKHRDGEGGRIVGQHDVAPHELPDSHEEVAGRRGGSGLCTRYGDGKPSPQGPRLRALRRDRRTSPCAPANRHEVSTPSQTTCRPGARSSSSEHADGRC